MAVSEDRESEGWRLKRSLAARWRGVCHDYNHLRNKCVRRATVTSRTHQLHAASVDCADLRGQALLEDNRRRTPLRQTDEVCEPQTDVIVRGLRSTAQGTSIDDSDCQPQAHNTLNTIPTSVRLHSI